MMNNHAVSVTYLETGSTNPYYNLAFEEYVLCNRTKGDILILWQNDNTIVVGQNQNTEAEINRKFVDEHGIRVVRRTTGGGAVYHDLGNLNYSFITDLGNADELTMERFTRPIVDALTALGVNAAASGRNDIVIDGRKVSGTAQRIVRDRILHHGTLLFDSDPTMVAGALQVDPEKFRSKSAKSVRSRIGNIRSSLPKDMTLWEFWDYLKERLAGNGFLTDKLSDSEIVDVKKLMQEKYGTWEWNYGHSPEFQMQRKRFWDGGSLEVRTTVDQGLVKEIAFYGDFLAVAPLKDIVSELCGVPFTKDAFREVLRRDSLPLYFGTITVDEILKTVFED